MNGTASFRCIGTVANLHFETASFFYYLFILTFLKKYATMIGLVKFYTKVIYKSEKIQNN